MDWGKRLVRSGSRHRQRDASGVSAGNYVLYIDDHGRPVYEPEVRRQIDRGWRAFWRSRGLADAPSVSRELLGQFELPEAAA
jgi:hypothetical protein